MRTFLDSGVLLTAWKGRELDALAALRILDDDQREFVTSSMVKLELLPKPTFFKNTLELEFYSRHFEAVKAEAPLNEQLVAAAFKLAAKYGLASADALNLAAAIQLGAAEFITTEKPGKPMFRVGSLKVVSLHAAATS